MIKNILIVSAIVGTIFIAYSMGMKQHSAQVNDLRSQLNTLQAQMNVQGENLKSSYHRIHRSLNLHMAETSIEAAVHDTLDQNFGLAKAAIKSSQGYLTGAIGNKIRPSDIHSLSDLLKEADSQLTRMDKGATTTLNEADLQVRKLIDQNSR